MEEARRFLTEEEGWTNSQFNEVDWYGLHLTLGGKTEGFKKWLSKQNSGFCGTRVMVGHYSGDQDADVTCPNCGCREEANHLCVCTNVDRTRLWKENVEELQVWLNKHGNTEPQLAYWVPKYLLARGTIRFQDLGHMSPEIKELAISQDEIGFVNFTEGRISKHFQEVQQRHLEHAESFMNGNDWVKRFITKLLQNTHSQWLFRNFTLHDKRGGELQQREIKQMREEALRLARTNPALLPKESRFLLELDEERYVTGNQYYTDKCYFLSAARAAMCAGRRKVSNGGRCVGTIGKRAATKMQKKIQRGLNKLRSCGKKVARQMEMETDEGLPFVAVSINGRKRRVVSGPARIAKMRSNRRFKPGD